MRFFSEFFLATLKGLKGIGLKHTFPNWPLFSYNVDITSLRTPSC